MWNAVRRRRGFALPLLVAWGPLVFLGALALRGVPLSAERHLYASSLGAAWLGGLGIGWLFERPRLRTATVLRALMGLVTVSWLAVAATTSWSLLQDWRDDTAMYSAMVRSQPWSAAGWIGRALMLIDAGRDREASRAVDRAAQLEPEPGAIPLSRAGIELHRGRFAEALLLARAARGQLGANRDAMLLEALALQRLGRWSEASTVAVDLYRRFPGDVGVQEAWGRQMLVEGRARELAAELERTIPQQLDQAGPFELLGEAHARLGEWTLARQAFQRSVTLGPDRYEAWLGLAGACALAGDRAGAAAALQNAVRLPGAADGRARLMLERLSREAR